MITSQILRGHVGVDERRVAGTFLTGGDAAAVAGG
jgi:hypothetical protein